MSGQPKMNIKLEPIDKVLEITTIIGLIFLIGIPLYYFRLLPDSIPTHFDLKGNVDSYGSKESIWFLPILGLCLCIGLYWLSKAPHLYNYPTEVTEQNAEKLYRSGSRMIRVLNSIIALGFAYLSYLTINSAINKHIGSPIWFLIISTLIILGIFIYLIYQHRAIKNQS